jgi:Spy/CpxP family protein refolding chaperone
MALKGFITLGIISVMVCFTLVTGDSQEEHTNPGRPGHDPGPIGLIMELDLSDAQKDEIAAIFSTYESEMGKEGEALKVAMEQLDAAIHSETFVEEDIRQASQALSQLQEELAVLRAQIRAKIMAVLDSEQKERLLALEAERRCHLPGPRPMMHTIP